MASTGLLLQWTDPIGPALLALGAAIQPRSPRPGRWLMWVSALSMNALTSEIAVGLLADVKTALGTLPGLVILLALALVLWSDVELVMDVASRTRLEAKPVQASPRTNLDWVVWIAAVALSAYYFWRSAYAVRAYRLHGRFDLVLVALGLDAVAVVLDIALIIRAVKSRRTE